MKFNIILSTSTIVVVMIVALVVGCKKPDNGPPVSTDPPKQLISVDRANQMYKAYQARYNAVTEFRQGKEDARYGWHSIEFYKNYIAYLEEASKKAKVKISGLRLYYVAYPDDERSKEQRDYQTYIFVPTYYDEATKKHIAFDPTYLDDNGVPIPIHKMITNTDSAKVQKMSMAAFIMVGGGEIATGGAANMGEMCKPNCSE
jgi:hypothetical protein